MYFRRKGARNICSGLIKLRNPNRLLFQVKLYLLLKSIHAFFIIYIININPATLYVLHVTCENKSQRTLCAISKRKTLRHEGVKSDSAQERGQYRETPW